MWGRTAISMGYIYKSRTKYKRGEIAEEMKYGRPVGCFWCTQKLRSKHVQVDKGIPVSVSWPSGSVMRQGTARSTLTNQHQQADETQRIKVGGRAGK